VLITRRLDELSDARELESFDTQAARIVYDDLRQNCPCSNDDFDAVEAIRPAFLPQPA